RVHGPVCCAGFWRNTITKVCEACPIGYLGFNCSTICAYPSYGKDCQKDCNCEEHLCHHGYGCIASTKAIPSSDGWDTSSKAWIIKNITEGRSTTTEPSVTITSSTYNPDNFSVNTELVVYIGIILIGLFVLFFGLCVVTYVYQKCTKRADIRNGLESNIIDQFVQYKTLNFELGEQDLMLNQEQRGRLKSDPTYLSPVFDGGTSYEEFETRNDPVSENMITDNEDFDESIEMIQETIPQSNMEVPEDGTDLAPEHSPKHIYVKIVDDDESGYINKNENTSIEDFNDKRRSPEGRESGYVNS
ncbi:uncharacterized protein LOC134232824, partial [Saccostrea cucullata]|uniref:uncharacterized protein LOC134232824 n=1 Tax=Saccostrea cuccullata TaxID=36930 RepID=UPI002ED65223